MLREEISLLMHRELKDPRLGFATITGAQVTPDLRHAKVFVSVMGTDEEKRHSLAALNRGRGFLRTAIGKRAHLRTVPEMTFLDDDTTETGSRISQLLEEVKRAGEEAPPADVRDTDAE